MKAHVRRWLVRGAATLVALSAAAFVALGDDSTDRVSSERAREDASAPRVGVVPARYAPDVREHRFHGVMRTAEGGPVAFVHAGRVETIAVELGDRVEEGQTIARLEADGWRNAVQQAEAALTSAHEQWEQAVRDLGRVDRLGDAATDEEREGRETLVATWRAQVSQAEVALTEAQRQLDEATLRSPYNAVVTSLPIEAGQVVSAGGPVAFLSSTDPRYEIELLVPASVALALESGDPLTVRPTFLPGHELTGTVRSVADHAAEPSMLFPVVAALDSFDAALPSGSPAEVTLRLNRRTPALLLPPSAVVGGPDLTPRVYVVEDDRIRVVRIDDPEPTAEGLLIPPVVAVGTPVVVSGQVNLSDGLSVEVIR
ncbi:MAG: efflux RND transporter periplasmic adaptor subunit [Spirochaetales bacterium]|nr:efflux RND transporter periplasmic adaptor subunit [Spirochaetales bacterium]